MLLKRVLKHKTSFICYFEFHDLYLFTFSRLKSLPCPSSTHFAGQLAHVIGPLKCYNDDYQCYDYQCYPRFTLISAFYPLICVLLSYPRFTLISVFYPPSVRTSVRISVRTSVRISVRTSVRTSVRISVHPSVSAFYPYPHVHCQFLFNSQCFRVRVTCTWKIVFQKKILQISCKFLISKHSIRF